MKGQWIVAIVGVGVLINMIVLYFLYFNLAREVSERPVSIETKNPIVSLASDIAKMVNTNTVAPTSTTAIQSGEVVVETPVNSENITALSQRIDTLESSFKTINGKIVELENTPSTTAIVRVPAPSTNSGSTGIKEVTIWFGNGDTTATDWIDIPGMNAYIDTTKYTTISDIRFEAVLRIPNAQGYVFARLYNKTDDRPVWTSEVSSETDTAILKQSSPLVLENGNKLYQVQLKSTIGVQAIIDSGRVKIQLQ